MAEPQFFLQMWAGSCATYRRQLYWCFQTDFFHHDEKMNPSLEMAVQVIFGCVDFNLGVFFVLSSRFIPQGCKNAYSLHEFITWVFAC